MTEPPRAFTSCMLPIIFSNTWSCGAIATTGMLLVDQRDRTVLHFAGRIALGVDVRNLLQLQRAFERDRIVDAAAEKQEVGAVVEPAGDLLDLRRELQRLLEQLRQLQQRVDVRLRRRRRRASPRTWPSCSASRYSATSCEVNALVDATPISGPACV